MGELATSHMDFSMSQCDQCEDLKQRIKELEAENKKKDTAIEKKVDELIEAYKWNYEVKEDLKQLRRMYE